MINWKKITQDNFIEFLSKSSIEDIEKHGIVPHEVYASCYDDSYVFLSDDECVVTSSIISFDENGVPDCREFKAECDYHNLTHFALRSEFKEILPK